jgi:hypothetical protein
MRETRIENMSKATLLFLPAVPLLIAFSSVSSLLPLPGQQRLRQQQQEVRVVQMLQAQHAALMAAPIVGCSMNERKMEGRVERVCVCAMERCTASYL